MKVTLKLICALVLLIPFSLSAQDNFSPVPDDQMPERFKHTKQLAEVLKDLNITVKTKKDHHNGNPFSKDYDVSVNRFTFTGIPSALGVYGSQFLVQGYIYPAGTFAENGVTSGITDDGAPEFPDMVVGVWYCTGTRLTEGGGESGASSLTTQIFDFNPENPGSNTIVTHGFERFDANLTWYRALTGGTGVNSRARGQQGQTAVGANVSGMGNLSMSLHTNPWPLLKK